jgi:hypothetical protein
MTNLHPYPLSALAASRQRELVDAARHQRDIAEARAARKEERKARRAARRAVAIADNPLPAITLDADNASPAVAAT